RHICRHDGRHTRLAQGLTERFDARTAPVIDFAHQERWVEAASVVNMARSHPRTHDPTTPPEDRLDAHHLGELRRRLDPILQGYHTRVRPHQCREGPRHLREVPRFYPDHDDIHDADLGRARGGEPRLDHTVPMWTDH